MKSLQEFDLFLLGGGGHARVLLDILSLIHPDWHIAILDRDISRYGTQIMGAQIIGGDDLLEEISAMVPGARFSVGIGTIGDSSPRKRLFDAGIALGLSPETLIHPTAVVSKFARVDKGAQLLPACIVNSGVSIGHNVIINSGAVIEHDCVIKDHVHIASGATLSGTVTIGESAHVGAGATIRQCLHIGNGAIVGVGSVVVKDVPDGDVVIGVPAKPLRKKNALGKENNPHHEEY
jgi:sugar O-acyltransferase (sialic acid O-acetyltransferase NeuD family)